MPGRSLDTMSEAIALSSPSGRLSRRTRRAAVERLRRALFSGVDVRGSVAQPSARTALVRHAAELRALAARGMKPRAYVKRAEELEALAQLNPVLEGFDLADRREWEQAIRSAGGLHIGREDRGDFEEVPRYLKGYRHGIAPDELVQQIADAMGRRPRDVEVAMFAAFHRPRRRPEADEIPEWVLEDEAQTATTRGLTARPRVRVVGDAFELGRQSPFKGIVHRVNRRGGAVAGGRRLGAVALVVALLLGLGRAPRAVLSLLLVLLAAAPAVAQVGSTRLVTFADVTVTGAVTTVRAANSSRVALNCTNNDAAVNVRWGDTSITASRGQRLRANGTLTYSGTAAVSMISEGANVVVSCTEETR
jgi:hypothetical protein